MTNNYNNLLTELNNRLSNAQWDCTLSDCYSNENALVEKIRYRVHTINNLNVCPDFELYEGCDVEPLEDNKSNSNFFSYYEAQKSYLNSMMRSGIPMNENQTKAYNLTQEV